MSRLSPLVLFVSLALAACASSGGTRGDSLGGVTLVGSWSETWAPGQPTDIDYHDVYAVKRGPDGALIVSCPEHPDYQFPRAEVRDGRRYLRLVNDKGDGDPYVIDYVLAPQGERQLGGRATTNHGVDVPILWDRID